MRQLPAPMIKASCRKQSQGTASPLVIGLSAYLVYGEEASSGGFAVPATALQ